MNLTAAKSIVSELARSQPAIYAPLARRREEPYRLRRIVRRGDPFVIDGFPRSANTFATHAFLLAQPERLLIGNHTHAAAQLHLARAYRVPALLVIRDPVGAVASAMVYDSATRAEPYLLRYLIFHRSVLRSRDAYEVGQFEDVTQDFAKVIGRVNSRYGTDFRSDYGTEEDVFASIESLQLRVAEATGVRDGNRSTTPSTHKAAANDEARSAIRAPRNGWLLNACERVYRQITGT